MYIIIILIGLRVRCTRIHIIYYTWARYYLNIYTSYVYHLIHFWASSYMCVCVYGVCNRMYSLDRVWVLSIYVSIIYLYTYNIHALSVHDVNKIYLLQCIVYMYTKRIQRDICGHSNRPNRDDKKRFKFYGYILYSIFLIHSVVASCRIWYCVHFGVFSIGTWYIYICIYIIKRFVRYGQILDKRKVFFFFLILVIDYSLLYCNVLLCKFVLQYNRIWTRNINFYWYIIRRFDLIISVYAECRWLYTS